MDKLFKLIAVLPQMLGLHTIKLNQVKEESLEKKEM
jgi:hypothetical protein